MSNHARLVQLVKQLAVVHGRVTLSSGIEADYYVDLRRATLHHEAAPLIGQVMLDMLDAAGINDFEAAGGLTMGADPVATAIMHQAAARGRAIDAFVVRKAAKAHGMGRQVEGPEVKGRRRRGSSPIRASSSFGTTNIASDFGAGPSSGFGNQTSRTVPSLATVARPWPQACV